VLRHVRCVLACMFLRVSGVADYVMSGLRRPVLFFRKRIQLECGVSTHFEF